MSQTLETRDVPQPREIHNKPRFSDKVFRGTVTGVSLISIVLLTLIGSFLLIKGYAAFKSEGMGFITGFTWDAYTDDAGNRFTNLGIGAMLFGTLLIALVSIVIGVPLSVLTALYLSFYAPPKLKKLLITVVDLMASFPSILYGMWGYFVLMPMAIYWAKLVNKAFGWIPVFEVQQGLFTRSPWVAGIVLAVMIIPIVTSVSREIFAQTPLDRIQAAYALGSNKWLMIKTVVLPFGANGVVGGAMLGLGRAFGETVAVFTVLNMVYTINWHVLFGAGGNVASHIILRWGEASDIETSALLAAGFILFLLTLLVNMFADFIVKSTVKKGK
jgi:phosphate transport system permease protein